MIVLDASAVVELLLGTLAGRGIAARITDPGIGLHVPHLLDVEVAQALRRHATNGQIDASTARQALDNLRDLPLERHAHDLLLDRVWALRQNLSAYDAVYVALAEALGAILITCDRRMARVPSIAGRVLVVAF